MNKLTELYILPILYHRIDTGPIMNKSLSASNSWISCTKETTILALPILGAHVIEALIPFLNTAMAASLGEVSLAAAGLAGSSFFAFMGFCWGVIASVGIITANKIGESNSHRTTGMILWSGMITSIMLSLPVMLIFHHMHSFWLYWGQDSAVTAAAQQYINGLSLAVIADLAKFAVFQYAIACNKPRIPLIGNIISIPLLLILNYFLIPQYGIYGIGLGTAVTYWLVFGMMFVYLLTSEHFKSPLLQTHAPVIYLKSCIEQLRLGIPIGLMFSIELLFFMVFALLMGSISQVALAANQIAMQWMFFTIMLAYGFTEAVTILVAKANGSGSLQLVKRYATAGIVLATASTLLVTSIYWFAPALIVKFDLGSQNVPSGLVEMAIKMLMFCGIYQVLDCIRIVISGALRGMNDSQYPMWMAVISFWVVGLSAGYMCAFIFHWHETGLWIGLIIAAMVNILLQYYRIQNKIIPEMNQTSPIQESV